MSNNPKIGESEWYVMKALWENSPLSGNDIVKAVSKHTDWSQSTILTMIRRLAQKNAIGVKLQRVKMYYPLIEEKSIARKQTDMFVDRVYKGSLGMLVKGYLENGNVSPQELEELKKLLDGMK